MRNRNNKVSACLALVHHAVPKHNYKPISSGLRLAMASWKRWPRRGHQTARRNFRSGNPPRPDGAIPRFFVKKIPVVPSWSRDQKHVKKTSTGGVKKKTPPGVWFAINSPSHPFFHAFFRGIANTGPRDSPSLIGGAGYAFTAKLASQLPELAPLRFLRNTSSRKCSIPSCSCRPIEM